MVFFKLFNDMYSISFYVSFISLFFFLQFWSFAFLCLHELPLLKLTDHLFYVSPHTLCTNWSKDNHIERWKESAPVLNYERGNKKDKEKVY